MRFINPRTDFAFKKIFGSENSKDVLLSFLNSILELDFKEVTIVNPYQAPKTKGVKESYVDIKAKSRAGEIFVIEMQVLNHEGFEKRILYNATKAYANQIEKGDHFKELKPVIAITITDFKMFEDSEEIISYFRIIEKKRKQEYSKDLELVFVELSKFKKEEHQLTTLAEKWLYFLKKADDLKTVPNTLESVSEIKHAFEIANTASMSNAELDEEEKRTMWLATVKDLASDAGAKGEVRGEARGRTEGLVEGEAKGEARGRVEGRGEAIIQFCQEGLLLKSQALEKLKILSEKLSPDFYQKCVDEVMDIVDKGQK